MRRIKYFQDCENIYLKQLGFYDENNNTTDLYTTLQNQWDNFKKEYKNIFGQKCPYPDEVRDVLIGKFSDLVDIYIDFVYEKKINEPIIKKKNQKIYCDLYYYSKAIFNYDTKSDSKNKYKLNTFLSEEIANFFKAHEELDLTTCFYCDAAYINHFTSQKTYRMYDLDHFLEKADCPILGISLYNFVPSCQICNSKVKGQKSIETQYGTINKNELKDYLIRLSPTSSLYNFEDNVTIEINPISLNYENDFSKSENFKIVFYTTDKYSKADIKGFMLQERYNYINLKNEALNLLRLKKKYPDIYISEISSLLSKDGLKIPEEDIKEDIFHLFSDLKNRRIFSKMKEDIITK